METIRRLLQSRTARTTVLLAGLVAAALYADSHVKGDMDLAQENAICHNQRQQMMAHITKTEQTSRRLKQKVDQYEKVMEGTEYAGLRVVAAAIQQAMGHEATRGILPEHVIQRFRLLL